MVPDTRPSILERVRRGGDESRKALGEWFTAYQPALRGFVICRFPRLAHEADDVVSGFVDRKVLNGVLLTGYAPQPGRKFRQLLWVALRRYCIEILRARDRRMATFELCEDFDEPDAPDPDGADVLWARQVLGRAIRRMRRECQRGGKTKMRVWCVFEARFLRPFRGQPELPYPELVARHGYSAPKIAQNDAGDGKRMLAEALLSVVSEYAGGDDARSELNDLWQIVRQAGVRANRGRTHETNHPDEGVDRGQPEHEDSRQPDA